MPKEAGVELKSRSGPRTSLAVARDGN
ncbi:hypothetical protein MY1884_009148 [Beauveria asiatica]